MRKAITLIYLWSALSALGANWYVRPTAQGSNNGTSWSNAWSLNSITWASLNGGDTVWLAGGNYATSGVTIGKSGASGNPITFKRVMATDAVPVAAAGWQASFDSTVSIVASGDGVFTWNSGTTGSNVTFDGRFKYGIAMRFNDGSGTWGCQEFYNAGVNVSNIIFQYCDIAGPGYNTSASYDYIGDTAAAFNIRGGVTVDNLRYLHCAIHGGPNLFYTIGTLRNLLVEDCDLRDNASSNSSVHANIMYTNTGAAGPYVFRNNLIHNWQVEGFNLWSGSASTTWEFDGNVFYDQSTGSATCFWPGADSNAPQGPLLLYNNTFYNVIITSGQSRSWAFKTGSATRNNIFWSSGFAGNSPIPTDSNYNLSNASTPGANSISSSSTNPFVSPTTKDFHIIGTVSSSLPRNKGTDLGAPYNVDRSGVTRGGDGSWDIGAYEYPAADSTPPTISSSNINAAGTQLTIVFDDNITTSSSDNSGWALTATNGAVTMSYSSGTDSTTILYSLSRTISGSETVSLAYTQPGNGVEDVSLNDLGSVSGVPVTNNSTQGKVATPQISLASGSYYGTQSITLSCITPGNTIYYTTDGSTPTTSSNVYSGAINRTTNTTLMAFATASGSTDSDVAPAVYQINSWTVTGVSTWKTFAIPQQTGTFAWSFDVSVDTAATDSVVGLSSTTVDEYGDFAPNIQFYVDNTIRARNGADYGVGTMPYLPDTIYHFEVSVNISTDTYSVTVTPAGGSPVVLATDYAFRNTVTELDNIGMTSLLGTMTVSNMSIGSDTTAPTPNPSTFASAPAAVDAFSVTMTATTASDLYNMPVQYFFQETTGHAGATSSGWQSSATYVDSGLSPNTQYTYFVWTRDNILNQGSPSSSSSATTPAVITGAAADCNTLNVTTLRVGQ